MKGLEEMAGHGLSPDILTFGCVAMCCQKRQGISPFSDNIPYPILYDFIFFYSYSNTCCPINNLKNFSKLFLNSKINFTSTSFKKEISILSHIEKKLQTRKTAYPKKHLAINSYLFVFFIFDVLQTFSSWSEIFNFEFLA